MNNITNVTIDTMGTLFNCEDLTNNGLYMIFVGYIFPLLSPTIRDYMKDLFIHAKNFGKVSGEIVSLTEFGFTKVQKIHNLEDMVKFIERVSKNKNLSVMKDELIKSATITVNDKVQMDPGYQVSPGDKIKYDEKIITPQDNNRVVMLNKPAGFITTVKDPLKRKTVMHLVKSDERLFPIGRLDKDTTGLLLLTNNGSLANFLMHPKNNIRRVYKVEINKILDSTEIRRLASKIYIGQKEWGKAEVLSQKKDRGRAVLHLKLFQGKKREIRRIIYRLKRELFSLQRIKFGPIELKDLPLGKWRTLKPFEYKSLNSIVPSKYE